MLTDRRTHTWMDDRQKVIIIAHPEHSSGEVKKKAFYLELCSNSNTYEISKQLHDIFSDCSGKIGLGNSHKYQDSRDDVQEETQLENIAYH